MTAPNDTHASTTRDRRRRHTTGVALVLTAGVLLSLAGITLRHMESASGWQILLYRSFTFFIVVALYLAGLVGAALGFAMPVETRGAFAWRTVATASFLAIGRHGGGDIEHTPGG